MCPPHLSAWLGRRSTRPNVPSQVLRGAHHLQLLMVRHHPLPPSAPNGPPAYPPSSPEAPPHTVEAYSMPPLAPLHSAAMHWRPAHGGCGADPEAARPTVAVPTQIMNIETIAALSGLPGWPWRLVPCRTAGGTPSWGRLGDNRENHLKI